MARLIAVSVILSLFTVFSALAQPIAYIGSNNTNEVSIIDVPSNRVVASSQMSPGTQVNSMAVSPDSRFIYFNGNVVTAIDTSDSSIAAQVDIGTGLSNGIDVTPDGKFLYSVSSVTDTLTVIRTSDFTITDTIPLGQGPNGVSFTPDGKFAYIADQVENSVYVVDTASVAVTVIIPIPGGSLVRNIRVAPNGKFVYISSVGANTSP